MRLPVKNALWPYGLAMLVCLGVVLPAAALSEYLGLTGIGMLFLLAVVLVAVRSGVGPALFAAFFAGLLFNFFFVYPPLDFAFKDPQYLITFGAMLMVGVFSGSLTAQLRSQADTARRHEQRARLLSAFARDMSAAQDRRQVTEHAQRALGRLFGARIQLMLPDELVAPRVALPGEPDAAVAAHALAHDAAAGLGTAISPGSPYHYIPLRAANGVCGVLAMQPRDNAFGADVQHELEAFARLVAIALERVQLVEVSQAMRLDATAEHLRNSMLAALSHDLRTPLSSLTGLADALAMSVPPLSEEGQAMVNDIRESALHMGRLVNNILDMARIRSGGMTLRSEWNSLEEIVGSALRLLRPQLAGCRLVVDIPATLPLLECDAMLIERVVANLVDNAVRHAGAGCEIRLLASQQGNDIVLVVADNGAGLPTGIDPFARFAHGDANDAATGVGLGLAICRAFVLAHAGTISAVNCPEGGAAFTVRLPAGNPPLREDDDDDCGLPAAQVAASGQEPLP